MLEEQFVVKNIRKMKMEKEEGKKHKNGKNGKDAQERWEGDVYDRGIKHRAALQGTDEILSELVEGEDWVCELLDVKGKGESEVYFMSLTERTKIQFIEELPGHWVDPEILFNIQAFLFGHVNVLIEGPAESGKTTLWHRLAKYFRFEFIKVDCGTMKSVQEWFGEEGTRDGQTLFRASVFLKTLEEAQANTRKRYLILLDEISRVPPVMHNSLMGIFDNTRTTSFTTTEGTRRVTVAPNVYFGATHNAGRQFTGTFVLDEAFESRFQRVKIGFPPEDYETRLLVERYDIPESDARKIVKSLQKLREASDKGMLRATPPGVRKSEYTAILVNAAQSQGSPGAPKKSTAQCILDTVFVNFEGEISNPNSVKGKAFSEVRAILPEFNDLLLAGSSGSFRPPDANAKVKET